MTHDHHDRDVVVTDGGGGASVGMIVGIIVAVLIVLALIWYFGFAGGLGNNQPAEGPEINIEQPQNPAPPDQPAP
ncbi:MAG: hypothetical protein M3N29_07770 [Chloroflexota bacterium]|nr:hypothetical protein [Chloroflexota bacterium]